MNKKNFIILVSLLILHLFLLLNLQFTAWPEMLLWPYFLLKGWLPYRDFAMAHSPLLPFDLAAFFKIFGLSLLNLKIYTWVLILITDLLVFFVARKISKNNLVAFLSLGFYILWQPYFEGNGLWFDLALTPIFLLIFYFLYQKEFFWAGLFWGLALLAKQTAFWLIFPIILSWWIFSRKKRNLAVSALAASILPVLTLVIFGGLGIFGNFYFWAVKFGMTVLPQAPGQVEYPTIKQVLSLLIPFAFVFSVIFAAFRKTKVAPVLIFWAIFASLGVFPRWSLFHFQPALPFLALISGSLLPRIKKGRWWVVYLVLVILGTVYLQGRFYRLNWQKPTRFFEPETLAAAQWLKENTTPGEKIFILNSWDHLYVLSNTLPAVKPWVPILPWYLNYPGIQEKMIKDLAENQPRIIIFEPYKQSGLGSYRPKLIADFVESNYSLKGVISQRFWILEKANKTKL